MRILAFCGLYELLNLVETYFWKHFSASSLLFLHQTGLKKQNIKVVF